MISRSQLEAGSPDAVLLPLLALSILANLVIFVTDLRVLSTSSSSLARHSQQQRQSAGQITATRNIAALQKNEESKTLPDYDYQDYMDYQTADPHNNLDYQTDDFNDYQDGVVGLELLPPGTKHELRCSVKG